MLNKEQRIKLYAAYAESIIFDKQNAIRAARLDRFTRGAMTGLQRALDIADLGWAGHVLYNKACDAWREEDEHGLSRFPCKLSGHCQAGCRVCTKWAQATAEELEATATARRV